MSFKKLQKYCDFLNNRGEKLPQALSFFALHITALQFLQKLSLHYVPALIIAGV